MKKCDLSNKAWIYREEHSIREPGELSVSVVGSALVPLIDVWEPIAVKLGVSVKQACDLAERAFLELGLTLYIDSAETGLWRPIEGTNALGQDKVSDLLVELWNGAAKHEWDLSKLTEWRFLRITPEGQNAIFDTVDRISKANPDSLPKEFAINTATKFQVASGGGSSKTALPSEKPLNTRERNTLLTIIGVLCTEAKIPYKNHSKAAGLILSTAAGMGISIGESTIEDHLKKIPDALAGRMK